MWYEDLNLEELSAHTGISFEQLQAADKSDVLDLFEKVEIVPRYALPYSTNSSKKYAKVPIPRYLPDWEKKNYQERQDMKEKRLNLLSLTKEQLRERAMRLGLSKNQIMEAEEQEIPMYDKDSDMLLSVANRNRKYDNPLIRLIMDTEEMMELPREQLLHRYYNAGGKRNPLDVNLNKEEIIQISLFKL